MSLTKLTCAIVYANTLRFRTFLPMSFEETPLFLVPYYLLVFHPVCLGYVYVILRWKSSLSESMLIFEKSWWIISLRII